MICANAAVHVCRPPHLVSEEKMLLGIGNYCVSGVTG